LKIFSFPAMDLVWILNDSPTMKKRFNVIHAAFDSANDIIDRTIADVRYGVMTAGCSNQGATLFHNSYTRSGENFKTWLKEIEEASTLKKTGPEGCEHKSPLTAGLNLFATLDRNEWSEAAGDSSMGLRPAQVAYVFATDTEEKEMVNGQVKDVSESSRKRLIDAYKQTPVAATGLIASPPTGCSDTGEISRTANDIVSTMGLKAFSICGSSDADIQMTRILLTLGGLEMVSLTSTFRLGRQPISSTIRTARKPLTGQPSLELARSMDNGFDYSLALNPALIFFKKKDAEIPVELQLGDWLVVSSWHFADSVELY
jgi:hypothetical protein